MPVPHAESVGNIVAIVFAENLLPKDDMNPVLAPVQGLGERVVGQPFHKQGVADEDDLFVVFPKRLHQGHRHVFPHTGVGNGHAVRRKQHAHREAIDEQGFSGFDLKRLIHRQVGEILVQFGLGPVGQAKGESSAAAVPRAGKHLGQVVGQTTGAQPVDGEPVKGVGPSQ